MFKYYVLFIILLFSSCNQPKPELKLVNDIYDFGVIKKGCIYSGHFSLKNSGNDTLKISDVMPSCSCTNVHITKKIILPNDTSNINFSYSTYIKVGKQENYITVVANTDSVIHILTVKSFVK